MPYARIDTNAWANPKLTSLADGEWRLYMNAILWSVDNLTDGFIPTHMLTVLAAVTRSEYARRRVHNITKQGLWRTCEGGWLIHDFLKHQRSKEQVEQDKAGNRRRQQRHRTKDGNAVTDAVTNASHLNLPITELTTSSSLPEDDTPNSRDSEDESWTQQPTGYNPHLWAQAVTHTKHQQHAGMTITYPDRYADTIYANLKEQDAIKDTNDRLTDAIANCTNCDNAGWTTDTKGDVEIPTTRCTHLHAVEEA